MPPKFVFNFNIFKPFETLLNFQKKVEEILIYTPTWKVFCVKISNFLDHPLSLSKEIENIEFWAYMTLEFR